MRCSIGTYTEPGGTTTDQFTITFDEQAVQELDASSFVFEPGDGAASPGAPGVLSLTAGGILAGTFFVETVPPCQSDFDGNGALDLDDITAFVVGFTSQDPIADFDGNTIFDLNDIVLFVNQFLAGCDAAESIADGASLSVDSENVRLDRVFYPFGLSATATEADIAGRASDVAIVETMSLGFADAVLDARLARGGGHHLVPIVEFAPGAPLPSGSIFADVVSFDTAGVEIDRVPGFTLTQRAPLNDGAVKYAADLFRPVVLIDESRDRAQFSLTYPLRAIPGGEVIVELQPFWSVGKDS